MDISAKPAVLHILLALADDPRHGYAIMQTVRDQSGGRIPLRTGSFYRHLAKMIDAGLVDEAPARRGEDDARRGAYYRLTARGRQLLAAERNRLAQLLAALDARQPASRRSRA